MIEEGGPFSPVDRGSAFTRRRHCGQARSDPAGREHTGAMSARPRANPAKRRSSVLINVSFTSRDIDGTRQRPLQHRKRYDCRRHSGPGADRVGTVAGALVDPDRDGPRTRQNAAWVVPQASRSLPPGTAATADRERPFAGVKGVPHPTAGTSAGSGRFARFRHSRRLCLKLVTPRFCWGRWVELRGFEPLTFSTRMRGSVRKSILRSPHLADIRWSHKEQSPASRSSRTSLTDAAPSESAIDSGLRLLPDLRILVPHVWHFQCVNRWCRRVVVVPCLW